MLLEENMTFTDVTKKTEESVIRRLKEANAIDEMVIIESTLNDHVILFLNENSKLSEDLNLPFRYLIFKRVFATSWTFTTTAVFTNDVTYVEEFIRINDVAEEAY